METDIRKCVYKTSCSCTVEKTLLSGLKGLDPRMIDRPVETVAPEVMQDAEWLIETYEPRVTVNEIRVGESDGTQGRYTVTADVTEL